MAVVGGTAGGSAGGGVNRTRTIGDCMAGTRDELGKLFRPMGEREVADADSASRMRALSGLARLLRAAEEAREFRRAYRSDPAAAEAPADDRSNVVRLIVPARA